jgi:predicted esterase
VLGCAPGNSTSGPTGGGIARLSARPGIPTTISPPGTYLITPSNINDGVLIVPQGLSANTPAPLVVALHGAGGGSASAVTRFASVAQSRGFLLLAPGARGLTWDVMSYKYSYDVTFIDAALSWVFAQRLVDPTRITLQGFSDGASYALGLGAANGDLFPRVVANSPGYVPRSDSPNAGRPQYWFSHGTQDSVLRIDGASRAIVPALRNGGYDVTFVEFDGGHEIPPSIFTQSLDWMLR